MTPFVCGSRDIIEDEAFVIEDHPALGFYRFDPASENLDISGGQVGFSQLFENEPVLEEDEPVLEEVEKVII